MGIKKRGDVDKAMARGSHLNGAEWIGNRLQGELHCYDYRSSYGSIAFHCTSGHSWRKYLRFKLTEEFSVSTLQ